MNTEQPFYYIVFFTDWLASLALKSLYIITLYVDVVMLSRIYFRESWRTREWNFGLITNVTTTLLARLTVHNIQLSTWAPRTLPLM